MKLVISFSKLINGAEPIRIRKGAAGALSCINTKTPVIRPQKGAGYKRQEKIRGNMLTLG